jgi:LacI family repressor for deo operon, udp, cdd, tsx, nupC, and nupG
MKRLNIPVNKLAKEAGLSPATVSRVLHHRELVNQKTRLIVETKLKEQGYDIDELLKAQSEASKRIITVVVPSIVNPFYYKILKGIESSASSHNFEVVIYQSTITQSNVDKFLKVVNMTNTRGVISLSRKMEKELADSIFEQIPIIQCCEYNKDSVAPYVGINDFAAAKGAVDYIVNMGYKKVAFINGPMTFSYAQERLRGFEAALEEHSITIPRTWKISLPDVAYDLGYSAACQILGATDKPDAIFCAADVFASSVLKAANRFDLRVPTDLGVVGFDNIEMASITTPGLTTINQPSFQTGFTAAESLFELLYSHTMPRSILLDTELISRESIARR